MSIYCLFRPLAQRCSRHGCYSISHYKSPDTAQIRSRHGYHSDTYFSDLQLIVQQTILVGIFKPISIKILPSPNGIFKPIPSATFWQCKFTGTLVSNHLLPSSHGRQTRQSNSSGSRRLNRSSCCTPKFSLSFHQHFLITRLLEFKIKLGFALLKTPPCTVDLKLGFEFAHGFLDFQCSMWLSYFMLDL